MGNQAGMGLLRWCNGMPPNGHLRITAVLRCAPPFGRRLALRATRSVVTPLAKNRSASVVPISQVRKPAGRYTQWPFLGNVLEG